MLIPVVFMSLLVKVEETFCQDYIPVFTEDYGSRLSIEIDPISFLFDGHSFHVRYQPMFTERFLIGLGTYAMDLPDPVVDFNRKNRDMGWKVRIRGAYFLYGELYANQANHGWFIGEQIGFQRFYITNEREIMGSASFNNLLLLTYAGYAWHPYKGSFYIKPWVGIGFTERVDGLNSVGSLTYHISPFFGFLTFHLGYTF